MIADLIVELSAEPTVDRIVDLIVDHFKDAPGRPSDALLLNRRRGRPAAWARSRHAAWGPGLDSRRGRPTAHAGPQRSSKHHRAGLGRAF